MNWDSLKTTKTVFKPGFCKVNEGVLLLTLHNVWKDGMSISLGTQGGPVHISKETAGELSKFFAEVRDSLS